MRQWIGATGENGASHAQAVMLQRLVYPYTAHGVSFRNDHRLDGVLQNESVIQTQQRLNQRNATPCSMSPSSCTLVVDKRLGACVPGNAVLFLQLAALPSSYTLNALLPAISFRSHPRRYSRRRYWFASWQLVTRKAFGSHSTLWPTRKATFASWKASVNGPA